MHHHMLDQLTELKLKGFKEAYLLQTQNPDFLHMSFEERLAHLVDSEVVSKKNDRMKRSHRGPENADLRRVVRLFDSHKILHRSLSYNKTKRLSIDFPFNSTIMYTLLSFLDSL